MLLFLFCFEFVFGTINCWFQEYKSGGAISNIGRIKNYIGPILTAHEFIVLGFFCKFPPAERWEQNDINSAYKAPSFRETYVS